MSSKSTQIVRNKQENNDSFKFNSQPQSNGIHAEKEAIGFDVLSPVKQATGDSPEVYKTGKFSFINWILLYNI